MLPLPPGPGSRDARPGAWAPRLAVLAWLAAACGCAPPASPALASSGVAVAAPAAADPAALPGVPAAEAPLEAAARRGDRAALRRHAWALWSALARDDGGGLPWERWPRVDQVFAPGAAGSPPGAPGASPGGGRVALRFKPPRRFDPDDDVTVAPGLADVRFNPAAARHLRAHALFDRARLAAARGEARAAPGPHAIPPFPRDAIALKVIWYPVHRHGLTALPVWDGVAAHPDDRHNSPSTWPRVVAIDPARRTIPPGETAWVALGERRVRAPVVPLGRFHARALTTPDEVASARAAAADPTLAVGDLVVLVAMHVSTKETADWVWATLWWHDRPDDPPDGDDRPASVPGALRGYRLDVGLRDDAPDGDAPARAAATCFNPWIEGRFAGGLRSSCVACHQRAVALAEGFLPVPRGAPPAGALDGELAVDFLWSIAFEAR